MQVGLGNLTKQNTQKPCKGCLCNLDLFRFRNQMSKVKTLTFCMLMFNQQKSPAQLPGFL